jgi:hypothetical protein
MANTRNAPSASGIDVVTNLRASLDHLVWGLAKPKDRGTHTKFPIHVEDTARDRWNFARALEGVPKRAIKAIERMQPYHGPGEAGDQPLAVLNALVNEDKHRNLLTVKLAVRWGSSLVLLASRL